MCSDLAALDHGKELSWLNYFDAKEEVDDTQKKIKINTTTGISR